MYRKGIKVIASTSIPQGIINETIVSDTAPFTRENGGTLRTGDRWWQPTLHLEHLWVERSDNYRQGSWTQVT
jgi:hypothetical protein